MTPVQRARLAGFNTSLRLRGVALSLKGTDHTFCALIEHVQPDGGEYSLSNETRAASKIHILRDSEGVDEITVGSILINEDAVHRVVSFENNPANIAVVFHCESA